MSDILFCTPSLKKEFGGPAYSVKLRYSYLKNAGASVRLFSPEYDLHDLDEDTALVESLTNYKRKFDLVHNFGVWTLFNHRVSNYCRYNKLPMIISPMGMLEPWAMNNKKLKKKVAWYLYQKRDLMSAVAIHATAQAEAENILALSLNKPVAVIPHGIELPKDYIKSVSITQNRTERVMLFISRINPKKGLLNLVEAWNMVRPPNWKMVVAGPDECGHLAIIKERISDYNLDSVFEFVGPVYEKTKEILYRNADIFVLPTFSENFGIVIPEAMSYGLPVITTKGAPWEELKASQSGWWVDIGVNSLAVAIDEATTISDKQRFLMGKNGRLLVEKKYSWEESIRKTMALYEWLLHRAPRPNFVIN
jgi:glycosyltransferase involved in cell wall biosynthesis